MLSRWRAAALVAVVSSAYLAWLQFLTPWIVETDGYYHAKVAWLVRQHGPLKQFPWAAFSIWSEHFFDKEFGWHALLSLFTFGDLTFGAKVGTVFFGAFFFSTFWAVLQFSGVRHAWFWALFLLFGSGGFFGWRVGVTRPQVFSMALSLWTMLAILRRSPAATFGVSAAYALSYTAPHVAILYACMDGVSRPRDREWRLIAASTAGVLAGWLVHPNFPDNFIGFKVQIVDVLMNAWGFAGRNLRLGGEFGPPPFWNFLGQHLALWAVAGAAIFALVRGHARLDARRITLGLATIAWFLLTCRTKRFVEYWVPMTFWWSALVLSEVRLTMRLAGVGVAAAVALCVPSVYSHYRDFIAPTPSGEQTAALWFREHTPENALIFTCDWDDTPELFFFDHRNRYLVFLDPNFMYQWKPDVWELWIATALGATEEEPADIIVKRFGARYGFCTNDFWQIRRRLEHDPRVKIRTTQDSGFSFEITGR